MTREGAIKRLKEGEPFSEIYNKEWEEAKRMAIEALQERKTGKWFFSSVDGQLHCSACNHSLWDITIMALGGLPNACPWCTALMEVEDADSN